MTENTSRTQNETQKTIDELEYKIKVTQNDIELHERLAKDKNTRPYNRQYHEQLYQYYWGYQNGLKFAIATLKENS